MGRLGSHAGTASAALAIALLVAVLPAAAVAAEPASIAAFVRVPAATSADLPPTSAIVRYRSGSPAPARARARERAGVDQLRSGRARALARAEVVRPARGQTLDEAMDSLRRDPDVLSVEPALRRQLAGDPAAEPYRAAYQWGLENAGGACVLGEAVRCTTDVDIDALGGWAAATGTGITVAVLDDGVDFAHDELAGQAWVNPGESGPDGQGGGRESNGVDDDGNGFVDDVHGVNLCHDASSGTLHLPGVDWHGTAVASVLAAAANGYALAGVAPDARIMAVRWLVGAGCQDDFLASEAIYYAVDNGADIINASWGGSGMTAELARAIDYANAHGVLFVAAAGNGGTGSPYYPAASAAPNVLSVGSIDPNGYRSSFSNYGTWVDLAAPGSTIAAAYAHEDGATDFFALVDGTSFAAPHVAGVAALAGQANPALLASAAAMRHKVISSGWKDSRIANGYTASGRVADAAYAVDTVAPAPPSYVSARARLGSTIGTTTASMTLSWGPAIDATGIEYYRVRYRKAGATAWTTLISQTTARSGAVTLVLGSAYDVEVTARDRGANTATRTVRLTPTRYEEWSSRWTYGGTWAASSISSFSGGKARYTGTRGRWAQLAFTGRSIALVMPKGPTRGSADVYVDGVRKATVNLYASRTSYRAVVWSVAWGASAPHTLKVVVKGTSGHPRVDVDAAIVAR